MGAALLADGAEGDAKQVTFEEEGSKASAYSYSAYSSDEEEATGLRRFMPSFGSKKKKHRDEDGDGTGEKEMSEKEMKREEKRLEKEEKLRALKAAESPAPATEIVAAPRPARRRSLKAISAAAAFGGGAKTLSAGDNTLF